MTIIASGDAARLVPPHDPLGIPAPPWVFLLLSTVTFVAHVVFMNYVLGGSLWLAVWGFAGSKNEGLARVRAAMLKVMPTALSLAITMGIAPLLFVQVLYGQFFYVSNILLGFWWLGILAAVLVGFYFMYAILFRASKRGHWSPAYGVVLVVVALLFLGVGFVFVNNALLSQNPDLWPSFDYKNMQLVVPDGQLIARYLHFVIGALAVTGLWVVGIGMWRAKREAPQVTSWTMRSGLMTTLIATVVQLGVGVWFLFTLHGDAMREIVIPKNIYAILWMVGVAVSIIVLLFVVKLIATKDAPPKNQLLLAMVLMAVTLIGMAAGREGVRQAYLRLSAAEFVVSSWTINAQYGPLLMFLLTFVAGLGVLAVMVRWIWTMPHQGVPMVFPADTDAGASGPPYDRTAGDDAAAGDATQPTADQDRSDDHDDPRIT